MGFWLAGLIFCLSVYQNSAQHDYFASISGLEKLLAAEEILLIEMEQHLNEFVGNVAEVKNFITKIDEQLKYVNKKTYENPLSAIKAFKRIAIDWFNKESILLENKTEALEESYAMAQNELPAPVTFEDLNGAAEAISRLQFTYNLNGQDLANGILNGQEASNPLTADDCFTMASHMFEVKKFEYANNWFFIAKNKLEKEVENGINEFPILYEDMLLTRLVPSLINSGNLKLAQKLNAKLYHLQPQGDALEHDKLIREQSLMTRQSATNEKSWMKPSEEPLYKKVCSGELRQTPSEQRNLHCRYVCYMKFDCIISPFKFEELNLDPFVGFFYDVIYENEIQFILNATEGKLLRSLIGEENVRSPIRTSKNTWLNLDDYTALLPLAYRMIEMTGLDFEYREDLQVANYGIGGHYAPHIDPLDEDNDADPTEDKANDSIFDILGNRLLTALFYINDVDAGGATAFPFLKISVPPIKGSALVWYNLHKDLSCDYRTWHTGCPVISGSKWIITQWLHTFGQEFVRPCGLKSDKYVSLPFIEEIDEQYQLKSD